ncbi:MAG: DUF1343 domain-containing protein [Bacteroidales bacterium]|nr:DUF1343 domain-containing protein [Bacteroidales bacterium]
MIKNTYSLKALLVAVVTLAGGLAGVSCTAEEETRVVLGDEQFEEYLPLLEGRRVALFSNQSGIVGDKVSGSKLADVMAKHGGCFMPEGNDEELEEASMIQFLEPSEPGGVIEYGPHVLDALLEKGVDVRAIFSPEHGFRGKADAGELVDSSIDPETGVEILSLYEKGSRIPGKEKMDKFDVLVVDIQDVGLRYYTYYITMHHLMEACAKYGKKMVVLDRPNPNGFYVDGALLDMKYKSGIGWLPICTVHGLTLGEMARMINGEGWLEGGGTCDLEVIPCRNYTHDTRYCLILPPSPNLKDMKSVYLYSSTCYFEGSIATPGRGTEFPFEVFGHPDLDASEYDFSFTPRSIPGAKSPRYQDQECHGRDLRKASLETIWSRKIDLEPFIDAYNGLAAGDAFFGSNNHFELLTGQLYVREMIENGESAEAISAKWSDDVRKYLEMRCQYLLYPETQKLF